MAWNEDEHRENKNRELRRLLAEAREGRGYIAVYLGGSKVHGAATETKGHSGYVHPRAFCQQSTPRTYAMYGESTAHTDEVTCQRCLASMTHRGVI